MLSLGLEAAGAAPWGRRLRHGLLVGVVAAVLSAPPAAAHKPDFGEGAFADPATAYRIADPAVSIVVYREVTCDRPQLWMRLEGVTGLELFVQLLTPAIDRLAGYRPSLAIVGPGLPSARIGIDIPAGLGAVLFATGNVQPVVFDERFTGTRDWILVEETVRLPATGVYYVVAFDPGRQTGKLAVAVGTVEDFGLGDLFRFGDWRRQAREFHEIAGVAPAEPVVERVCPR